MIRVILPFQRFEPLFPPCIPKRLYKVYMRIWVPRVKEEREGVRIAECEETGEVGALRRSGGVVQSIVILFHTSDSSTRAKRVLTESDLTDGDEPTLVPLLELVTYHRFQLVKVPILVAFYDFRRRGRVTAGRGV